jgi:hypothetical protein
MPLHEGQVMFTRANHDQTARFRVSQAIKFTMVDVSISTLVDLIPEGLQCEDTQPCTASLSLI